MSVNEQNQAAAPIAPGSPLARVLDGYAVPGLSAGFADRVLAAAQARPAKSLPPLPELRRPARGHGWRMGRRIAIGVASFGVLATAAAATGLLQQLAIPVPSAQTVWASITGTAAASTTPARVVASPAPAAAPTSALVAIEGPIDTPEELGEAFRRIDQVRSGRREERRAIIDQRIKGEIERRRAAGLPVPTPEQEARFRERMEAQQARREQLADQQVAARRAQLEQKIESGEPLTREDFRMAPSATPRLREAVRKLRQLPPEERRAVWRTLSPEQRRAIIEEVRARRPALVAPPAVEPAPSPQASSAE